jgi:threonine/homoserine/homoserine lactone efflux protein
MDVSFLFKGLIIGFSLAVPVGPVGILCINRSISRGQIAGVISGFGAALADTIYGLIAGLGLSFVSDFLIDQKILLQTVGGIFLIGLGIKIYLKKSEDIQYSNNTHHTLLHDFVSTFLITVSNPGTILAFLAIFAGLGFSLASTSSGSTTLLVVGVFSGSTLWWLILSGTVSIFRNKMSDKLIHRINQVSGVFIILFGIAILTLLFLDIINIHIAPAGFIQFPN